MIAPSGPFDGEAFARGVARLRARFVVSHRDDIDTKHGFLAGDDPRRAAELLEALAMPDVDAIVAARGGHGATRILPSIPIASVAKAGKLLVGFSDITALHALWALAGLRSIHGPMVATLGRGEERLCARWMDCLEGRAEGAIADLRPMRAGEAEGPLLGGNLSVLAALVGTPYFPPLSGAILFLEDLNEAPYRLDRLLTTLRNAGAFTGLRGVMLGQFTHPDPEAQGALEGVLLDRLGDLGIPVLANVPAGHVEDNLELPFGAPVRIVADEKRASVTFLESAVAPRGPQGVP